MEPNYATDLERLSRDHAKAKQNLSSVEAARDTTIRRAHRHGGMTVRDIAGHVGMSHQRVGQIVARPDDHRPRERRQKP